MAAEKPVGSVTWALVAQALVAMAAWMEATWVGQAAAVLEVQLAAVVKEGVPLAAAALAAVPQVAAVAGSAEMN